MDLGREGVKRLTALLLLPAWAMGSGLGARLAHAETPVCSPETSELNSVAQFARSGMSLVGGSDPSDGVAVPKPCLGIAPDGKVQASVGVSREYLEQQLQDLVKRQQAGGGNRDVDLSIIDPKKRMLEFTPAGNARISNINLGVRLVSKLEKSLSAIFGSGIGLWGTLKSKPTIELRPIHTRDGIGFQLKGFSVNGRFFVNDGSTPGTKEDINDLAELAGIKLDKNHKITASDRQIKDAMSSFFKDIQNDLARSLSGITASGTPTASLLKTSYDERSRSALIGIDQKVFGKIGPEFGVESFGIEKGRLVLKSKTRETAPQIAQQSYSVSITESALGEQVAIALRKSEGGFLYGGTQIGGTFGAGKKDKFITLHGGIKDQEAKVSIYLDSTRPNRITLIPGQVSLSGNLGTMYNIKAFFQGDAAAQNEAQERMVDSVGEALGKLFAVDHIEKSGTVLQIHLNPRIAVGSRARFNLKGIKTQPGKLTLQYGLDLRGLRPVSDCK